MAPNSVRPVKIRSCLLYTSRTAPRQLERPAHQKLLLQTASSPNKKCPESRRLPGHIWRAAKQKILKRRATFQDGKQANQTKGHPPFAFTLSSFIQTILSASEFHRVMLPPERRPLAGCTAGRELHPALKKSVYSVFLQKAFCSFSIHPSPQNASINFHLASGFCRK